MSNMTQNYSQEKEMTDRELLEAAAKAAGIKIDKSEFNGGGKGNDGFDITGSAVLDWHNYKTWNPLTDDGDALRLAVKLKLCLFLEIPRIGIGPMIDGPEIYLDEGDDPYAATRHAIVRAAAEILENASKK